MDITFGEYVRERRLKEKLTLRSFANKMSKTPTYISALENGEKTPESGLLKEVADILNLTEQEENRLNLLAGKVKKLNPSQINIREREGSIGTVRIALRTVKNLDATDEEWEDFMRRLNKR